MGEHLSHFVDAFLNFATHHLAQEHVQFNVHGSFNGGFAIGTLANVCGLYRWQSDGYI